MNTTPDLGLLQMLLAYLLLLLIFLLVRLRGGRQGKDILLASFRMTVQLVLAGYLLGWIFDSMHPLYTVGVVILMEAFAVYTILHRSRYPLSRGLKQVIAFSVLLGTLVNVLFFLLAVMRIEPWYNPRFFIPAAGMLIGNSMNGIALGVNSLSGGMRERRNLVEAALMLGATPRTAARSVMDDAFSTAVMPTVNSMLGMGIVFIPGMMTGQIMSGNAPLLAVKYQIAIMLGIFASVVLTVFLAVVMGTRTFFNNASQLIIDEETGGSGKAGLFKKSGGVQ